MPIEKQRAVTGAANSNGQSTLRTTVTEDGAAIANPQFIEVSAALIFRDGKLLITQRRAGSHLGGNWEFPGGKREAGETFEQCLVREIREELGVETAVGELFEEIAHTYPEKSVRLKFFVCKLVAGEPRPLDCAAVKWIEKGGLDAHEFPAADARLLEKLKGEDCGWLD